MSDKSDKIFDPTPQRIKKAREDGNVFRSQEINSILMLFASISLLAFGTPAAFSILKNLAARTFRNAGTTSLSTAGVPGLFLDLGLEVLLILLPFMVPLALIGIATNIMQSGWNVTTKPLEPKPDKISPMKGLKRIFSARGLFTTVKSILKILVVGPIAYLNISNRMPEIVMLHVLPVGDILSLATHWLLVMLGQILLALLFLSGIDFAFEKWKYKEDLKMSKQEVKDEAKESEGDPQLRVKRRQLARDIAHRPRLDHAILRADVVITNPTHYAIVLRYDQEEAAAPMVLAKGIRKRALRIKALALENGVPTIENRPLARALYKSVPEMSEIPADLYPAVAAILAEVYRQKGKTLR